MSSENDNQPPPVRVRSYRPGDLPACSLDAGKGGLGLAPIAMAALAVLRRRRQRV